MCIPLLYVALLCITHLYMASLYVTLLYVAPLCIAPLYMPLPGMPLLVLCPLLSANQFLATDSSQLQCCLQTRSRPAMALQVSDTGTFISRLW